MVRSRLGLKALGLCALVLGLMAFVASGAQAETGADWLVEGKGVNASGLNPSVGIKEIENKTATLLTKIAGTEVEYLCTGAELSGAKLEANGSVTNGGTVRFTGCVAFLNKKLNAACEPKNNFTENGVISTKPGKGLLVLHKLANGTIDAITRIEAKEGETLAVIENKECAIGSKVPVIGKLTLYDAALTTESVDHLITQGPLTELWTISKTAEHVANIDGTALVRLTGGHLGLKWSGKPA